MRAFWDNGGAAARPAFIRQGGGSMTYGELYHAADAWAAQLPQRSLIFIKAANNIPTLIAYLGCLRNGHVCMPVSKDMGTDMFGTLCSIYEPDFIYEPAEGEEYRLRPYAEAPKRTVLHPDLALLLSTSGSTGSPKLVRLTKQNVFSNACAIAEYLELTEQERPVTNLPFYYSYGLSVLNSHLQVGATLLLTSDSIISPAFWAFCREQGVTSMSGVPYTYDMLEAVAFRKSCPETLRTLTQAGGHMAQEKVQAYAEWSAASGRRFYVMYGQTEATARMSYLPPQEALRRSSSIGIAIPGGSFSVLAEDGSTIAAEDCEGELIYHGANVSMGYALCKEDLALGDTNNGTLHTGDVAKRDAEGFYYITGRLKRFLKIAGNRFGLDELERQLAKQGIEVVCGGSDGRLQVAITDAAAKKATADYLKATWHLLRNQYEIRVVDSIPRSSTGKIFYGELFA